MKLVCEREALLQDCQLASVVALGARDIKPILRNLKAIAEKDKCTLMATDLEVGIRLQLRSPQVKSGGEAILPAARLLAILREATDEHLNVVADAERTTITGKHLEFEMPGEEPGDFPDVPAFSDAKYHEVTAGVLRTMIRRTVFAAAKESTRYAMTGVLWELEGPKCRLVATDSKRLALAEGPAEDHGGHDPKGGSHLVPTKAMSLLERNLVDDGEKVKVALRPNEVLFQTERATISSRLVEGRYPPYRDIIPKKNPIKVPVKVAEWLTAVRQAAVMIDDESKRVEFAFGSGQLTLAAKGATTGRSKVEMPIEYSGAELKVNFDPTYIIEMLKILDPADAVSLELADHTKPALFRIGSDYQYLVMPLS